jgi:diaminobutyrate-2-oxoglutarate transaminase
MAAGAKTLEIIQRDNLTENAKQRGKQLRKLLREIQSEYDCIAEVRGRGLMCAIEIVKGGEFDKLGRPVSDQPRAAAIQRAALERGLIIEKGGRKGAVLRFLPPLIISATQIDFVAKTIKTAIECTQD